MALTDKRFLYRLCDFLLRNGFLRSHRNSSFHGHRLWQSATLTSLSSSFTKMKTSPLSSTNHQFLLFTSVNGSVVPGVANVINHSSSEFDRVQFGTNLSASVKYKNKIFHFHSSSKTLKVVCFPLVFQVSPNSNNTVAPGTLLNAVTCSETDSD